MNESSLSFFLVLRYMTGSFEGPAKWTEKPISLSNLVTYFPDVDTSSAISGFCLSYLSLNSFQQSSLLAISYCSFMFPSSFSSVTYMERLCTSKPIMIPTTSIVVSESSKSEITRQTSIHPCFRVLCRDEGQPISNTTSNTTSRVRTLLGCHSDSHADIVMPTRSENFFHDISIVVELRMMPFFKAFPCSCVQ